MASRSNAGNAGDVHNRPPRGLLSAERVALNYMQRLSGIATLTHQFVDAVTGTDARILDTRKTTPGWRRLEKYAVRAGGGMNHRMDLALGGADQGQSSGCARRRRQDGRGARAGRLRRANRSKSSATTSSRSQAAVVAGAEIIMLDNMSVAKLREAVALIDGRAVSEASGGVTLQTVRAIAETGVDWISVGALTHSAKALDLALDFE